MASADVVVIGGGSTGTSIAFQLARRKFGKVILIERSSVGAGPTSRSIGIIRLHYTYEPLIRLAQRSLELFTRFSELTGAVCDFTRCGFLLLAAPHQLDGLRANVDLQRRLGVNTSVLPPPDLTRLDARMNLDGVAGGAFEPDSGFADGYATAAGFAAAARREGAEIWEGTAVQQVLADGDRVRGVRTTRGEVSTPVVLVAAGPWTGHLMRPLGVDVPVQSSRQQVVQLAPPAPFGRLGVVIEDMALGFYVRPEAGETVLAGVLEEAAEELVDADGFRQGVDFDFVGRVGGLWSRRFPSAAAAEFRRGYASLYDITPDWQPVLGAAGAVRGLYVAAGFSGHGFKLCPALGEVLAATIAGEPPAIDITMFRPSRFAEGQLIRGRHAQGILG